MVALVKQYLSQFKGGEENTANFTVDIFDMLHFIAKNKNDELSQVIIESATAILEACVVQMCTLLSLQTPTKESPTVATLVSQTLCSKQAPLCPKAILCRTLSLNPKK